MKRNQNGNTHTGIVVVIIGVIAATALWQRFMKGSAFSLNFAKILLIFGGIAIAYGLLRLLMHLLYHQRHRKLLNQYGIRFEEFAPQYLKNRLDDFTILDQHGIPVQVHFYLKKEGDLRLAVFQHCWSTGFGSGRRDHSGRGFVADLTNVPEIEPDDILSLFDPQTDLLSESRNGLFLVYSRNSNHRGFKPERILVSVCQLYRQRYPV